MVYTNAVILTTSAHVHITHTHTPHLHPRDASETNLPLLDEKIVLGFQDREEISSFSIAINIFLWHFTRSIIGRWFKFISVAVKTDLTRIINVYYIRSGCK